jgi:hypothetical protein
MTREDITITGDAVSDQLTMSRVDFIRLREADRALAVAAERERMTVNSIHTCHPECDRPGCVAVRKAVEAEREACAEYAAALAEAGWSAGSIADALRARGSK